VSERLRFRIFAHSWTSDWNHGNAHFLRGLAQELMNLGHEVRCYEEEDCWSRKNLHEEGQEIESRAVQEFRQAFPQLDVRTYRSGAGFGDFARHELRGADIVIVHEWNRPAVANSLLQLKKQLGFRALFHDTHHRAYTSAKEILEFNLSEFDGVLAFGEAIRRIYQDGFGVPRAWTFHEAADTAHFKSLTSAQDTDVIWVGNWGDEERTRELEEYIIRPAANMRSKIAVYGVRYPEGAQAQLEAAGIEYRGYLPNLAAPRAYAGSQLTLHVPRRFYANGLSGVPTIRVFETLACGIPLLCAPWTDTEGLFSEGDDYVCVDNGKAMEAEITYFLRDGRARQQLAGHGLRTIQEKHTCAHRARQLLEICEELGK
jgi:spore maturation protein CgeB